MYSMRLQKLQKNEANMSRKMEHKYHEKNQIKKCGKKCRYTYTQQCIHACIRTPKSIIYTRIADESSLYIYARVDVIVNDD